jgi:hypothetical protein
MNIKRIKQKNTGTYDLGVAMMTSALASHLSSDAKALLSRGKTALEMEKEEAPTRRSNSWPSSLAIVPVTGMRAASDGSADECQLSCGAFELRCGADILSCSDLGTSPFSPGAKRGRGDMCNNMDKMFNNMDNMDNMAANARGPCSNTRASGSSNARAAARFVEASAAAGDAPGNKTQGSKTGSKTSACTSARTSKVRHVIQAFQARIRMKNTRLHDKNTRLNDNTSDESSGAEEDVSEQDMSERVLSSKRISQQALRAHMPEQGALDHEQSREDDDDTRAGRDQHEQYEGRPTNALGGGGRGCGVRILKSTVYRDFILETS